ncbi:MAG: PPC domain-containing protein [Anaerolineae bacterium]|nr:PPC domain-containing protein [Anaerolineae bacterium]
MRKRIALLLLLLLNACSGENQVAELPTLAVLPTLAPSATPAPIRPLTFWESVTATLNDSTQVDRWQFSAQAGDNVELRTLGPVILTLQQAETVIAGPANTLTLTLPEDGDYLVSVQLNGLSSGVYELGLGYTDRPNPASFTATPPPSTVGVPTPTPPLADLGTLIGPLEDGSSLAGTLESVGERHVYTFEGQAGDYASIALSRVSGDIDPLLTLYSPSGQPLAVDDNTGGSNAAFLRNVPLRENGRYTVQAAGGGFTGTYQISLIIGDGLLPITPTVIAQPTVTTLSEVRASTPVPAEIDGELSDHVPVAARLDDENAVQRFFFQAEPGDFVTIGIRPASDSPVRPTVEIVNPAGEVLRSADTDPGTGEALIALLPITESDPYSLIITDPNEATGDYVITYGIGPTREEVVRGSTESNVPYESAINRRGLRDVWKIQLYEGDVITATVSPLTNTLDPVLELVAEDGTIIAQDDNSGGYPNPLLREVRIPAAGVYDLRVYGANADTVGPYRLVWRYVTIAPTFTPDPARYLIMSMADQASADSYLFYPFQGQAGQRVRIQVIAQPGSDLDPVAVLLGPDGSEIAAGDDSENDLNPRFTVELPADGTYTVRVNGYLTSGTFDLLVESLYQ